MKVSEPVKNVEDLKTWIKSRRIKSVNIRFLKTHRTFQVTVKDRDDIRRWSMEGEDLGFLLGSLVDKINFEKKMVEDK